MGYRGIYKLLPGHVLVFENGQAKIQPYWKPKLTGNRTSNETETEKISKIENLLTTSVQQRLVADVPVGIFLSGAYQDIMGDMHNLFGKVSEAHVFLEEDEDDGFYIEEIIPGAKNREVLEQTQYHSHDLEKMIKQQIDSATKADRIRPREGMRLLKCYQDTLDKSMYLEFE